MAAAIEFLKMHEAKALTAGRLFERRPYDAAIAPVVESVRPRPRALEPSFARIPEIVEEYPTLSEEAIKGALEELAHSDRIAAP